MERLLRVMALLVILLVLAGCSTKSSDEEANTEVMPENYGNAIILAQNEFANTFSSYNEIEITETHTMVRTNDSSRLIVQFSYSSETGNGVYGYEISRDKSGSCEIVQQGEGVTIDNLLKKAE